MVAPGVQRLEGTWISGYSVHRRFIALILALARLRDINPRVDLDPGFWRWE
ncbi:hypothetical protein GZL_08388 [Streptomyces sp. 769]|nr:hypothetical protein GZL_08388 [Streptomyces sp. 769]